MSRPREVRSRTGALAFGVAVFAAVVVAALALRPPLERSAGPPDFSLPSAMRHIEVIARQPHVTGSAASAQTRAYLVGELRRVGLGVEQQTFVLPERVRRRLAAWGVTATHGVNIVGRLPGSDPSLPPVLVMAHYDTVPHSPGAADNSAGVAVALESARVLKGRLRHDLIILLTDAEEPGLAGSQAFFAGREPIGVVINLEARGGGGRVALFETGAGQGELLRRLAGEVRGVTAHSFAMLVYRLLPNSTDFTAAKDRGLPGFNFAFIGRPGLYHSPLATPARIDAGSVRQMGYLTVDTVQALDGAETFASGGAEPVFSDLFGLFMVSHDPIGGWAPISLAIIALVAATALTARRGAWRAGEALAGLGVGLLFIPVAAIALFGAALLRGPLGYYEGLAWTGWLELQAALLLLGLMLVTPRRLLGPWSGWMALLSVGIFLSIALQLYAPQAGPLVSWPVMTAGVGALLLAAGRAGRWPGRILLTLTAAFVFYWAHMLFVGAGQLAPYAMAPFAFLAVLALWPFIASLKRGARVAIVAVLLVLAALAVGLTVRLSPPPPGMPTYEA